MKSVRGFLSWIVTVVVVAATVLPGHAQSGTGTRGRTDPMQRELLRRFESDAIEQALARGPRAASEERRLILVQIKEDFVRIQIVNDELQRAARASSVDLKLTGKFASEISNRARRLKDNLVLPEVEKTPNASESNSETSASASASIEQLRLSLGVLNNAIKEFVENPVFEKAGVIDAKHSTKASRDLEQIIAVSKQAKRATEQLLRARPQSAHSKSAASPAASPASAKSLVTSVAFRRVVRASCVSRRRRIWLDDSRRSRWPSDLRHQCGQHKCAPSANHSARSRLRQRALNAPLKRCCATWRFAAAARQRRCSHRGSIAPAARVNH